ncbi:MAG: 2-nitropropane dioxygenase [Bradyrhizobium sp.]|nr:2-nitropropane dioxygenase [Bradyrhizobium sp.]
MWPDRRLVDLFKIEHPLVLAPMAGFGTVGLAASVCAAGGLGSISCATMQPQLAAKTIEELRRLTSKPVNVNFFCHARARADAHREQAGMIGCCPIIANLELITNRRPAWISHRLATPCARSSRRQSPKW